jgi:hypothetical protein
MCCPYESEKRTKAERDAAHGREMLRTCLNIHQAKSVAIYRGELDRELRIREYEEMLLQEMNQLYVFCCVTSHHLVLIDFKYWYAGFNW